MDYNHIFDFDGTIANLTIDWSSFKKEIDIDLKKYGLENKNRLNLNIDSLKSVSKSILSKARNYEIPNGSVNYEPILKTLELIKQLNEFHIISNNLSETIRMVLLELGIENKCKSIVGIDSVENSKPNPESFNLVSKNLLYTQSIYYGDQETDKIFAEKCQMKFLYTNEI